MSQLGQVRIGHKAPDFHCDAVISGVIQGPCQSSSSFQRHSHRAEVSLSTFLQPSMPSSSPDSDAPWLLLLFIPAAFSFVCPTEVIAFQNCYDEFRDRNCNVAFISVDTKHSLWHWQNVPRQYGGLGNTDIPLLSDASHKIGRDYGVLIEEEGVCLRGMFIIDNKGFVQQVRLHVDSTTMLLLTRQIDHAQQFDGGTKRLGSASSLRGLPSCRKARSSLSDRLEAQFTRLRCGQHYLGHARRVIRG